MSGYFNDRTPRSSYTDPSVRKPRRVSLQTSPQRQSDKKFGPWEAYAGDEERYGQQQSRDPPPPSNTYWVNKDKPTGISVSPRRHGGTYLLQGDPQMQQPYPGQDPQMQQSYPGQDPQMQQPYPGQDVFALEDTQQPVRHHPGYVKSPVRESIVHHHQQQQQQQPVPPEFHHQIPQARHQVAVQNHLPVVEYISGSQPPPLQAAPVESYVPQPPSSEYSVPHVVPAAAVVTSPHLPMSIPLAAHQPEVGGPLSYVDVISKINSENPTLLRLKLKGNIQKLPIKAIKQSLESCTGIPSDRQILEKEGFYLSDDLTASAVGMVSGSVLTLSLAAPGQLIQLGDQYSHVGGDTTHVSQAPGTPPELFPAGSSRMFYYSAPHHQHRAISPNRH